MTEESAPAPHRDVDAATYLRQPGLKRALEGARVQLERLGRVGGTVPLSELSAEEASALGGLLASLRRRNRPRPGQPLRLPARDLDRALVETRFGLSLPAALELIGPPLDPRPQRRARARAAAEEAWAGALAHPLCRRDAAARAWVEQLRDTGTLARTAGAEGTTLLGQTLDLGDRLPSEPPLDRTRLATEHAGDPHALDEDRPLSRLLLGLLASRAHEPRPRIALERRALWQRFGVLSDAASADVLTLGLRPLPGGPLAGALNLLAGWHFRLTIGQLAREPLRFAQCVEVFVCENPTVLTEAEARHGARCRPLICTDGWPSSAAWVLLNALVTDGALIRYHSDFDWDGVRMFALLRSRFGARSWRFDETSYRTGTARHRERTRPLDGREPKGDAQHDLVGAMLEHRRELHEQAVLDDLLSDLA
jgi:uncharacterized protein (TIGR02679 family)